jgi:hypothetical protein
VGVDENGRWKADRLEPFNSALGGVSPQEIRDVVNGGYDGWALVALWLGAIGMLLLGVFGRSAILIGLGAVAGFAAALWTRSRYEQTRRWSKPHDRRNPRQDQSSGGGSC